MDLFDFFFPEQAQATHLRKIARQQSLAKVSTPKQKSSDVEDPRADVKFLTLVVAALLRKLSETETASPGDIQELVTNWMVWMAWRTGDWNRECSAVCWAF